MLSLPQGCELPGVGKILPGPQGNALVVSQHGPLASPENSQREHGQHRGAAELCCGPMACCWRVQHKWQQHILRPCVASFISQLHFSKFLTTSKCKTGTR